MKRSTINSETVTTELDDGVVLQVDFDDYVSVWHRKYPKTEHYDHVIMFSKQAEERLLSTLLARRAQRERLESQT